MTRFVAFGMDRSGFAVSAAAMTTCWGGSANKPGHDHATSTTPRPTITHSLHADERERGVDECAEETEEVPGRSGDAVEVGECAWVGPVSKTDPIVIRCSAEGDNEGHEDQADKTEDLDRRGDHFGFTKAAAMTISGRFEISGWMRVETLTISR